MMFRLTIISVLVMIQSVISGTNKVQFFTEKISSVETFTYDNTGDETELDESSLPVYKIFNINGAAPNENPSGKIISAENRPAVDEDQVVTWRIVTRPQAVYDYDYDQFKGEYEQYIKELKQARAKLNETDFQIKQKSECGASKIYNKGPFTVTCLLDDYYNGATKEIKDEAARSLFSIFFLWGMLLLVFLVVGWGHFGYCNTCCFCSICHPEDEYERLKQYLVLNQPGTITTAVKRKKDDHSRTTIERKTYKPNVTEFYLFNKLWNKIYRS